MEGHFEAEVGGGLQESPKKCGAEAVPAPLGTGTADGCFDCNICLDFAVDPVVTLCGHLYCWPCMYKWLELESTTPQQCPVCKASLSRTSLVPLYGRGQNISNDTLTIPRRPSVSQDQGHTMATPLNEPGTYPRIVQHQYRHRHHHHRPAHHDYIQTGMTPLRGVHPIIGSMAVAVLPWVFGNQVSSGLHHSSPYHMFDGSSSPGLLQRQELEAERSLHRISIFLFCFAVLCLLLF